MTDLLDIVEEPGPEVNQTNAFKHIWLSPRATFRFILKSGSPLSAGWFFVAAAITALLKRTAGWSFFNLEGNWTAVLLTFLGGALIGWVVYQVYAKIIASLSKRIGGKADTATIKTILAWSLIPYIVSVILILPQILIFGFGLFTIDKELEHSGVTGLLMTINVLGVVLWLWSATLLLWGLMIANDFNFWKAFLCAALPVFVFFTLAGAGFFIMNDLLTFELFE